MFILFCCNPWTSQKSRTMDEELKLHIKINSLERIFQFVLSQNCVFQRLLACKTYINCIKNKFHGSFLTISPWKSV